MKTYLDYLGEKVVRMVVVEGNADGSLAKRVWMEEFSEIKKEEWVDLTINPKSEPQTGKTKY